MARRKRATREQTTEPTPLTEQEQFLQDKYPVRRIVGGSLMGAGEHPDFLKKRSVEILCERCNSRRRIATSDLFQCGHCSKACKSEAQKESRETAKQADAE